MRARVAAALAIRAAFAALTAAAFAVAAVAASTFACSTAAAATSAAWTAAAAAAAAFAAASAAAFASAARAASAAVSPQPGAVLAAAEPPRCRRCAVACRRRVDARLRDARRRHVDGVVDEGDVGVPGEHPALHGDVVGQRDLRQREDRPDERRAGVLEERRLNLPEDVAGLRTVRVRHAGGRIDGQVAGRSSLEDEDRVGVAVAVQHERRRAADQDRAGRVVDARQRRLAGEVHARDVACRRLRLRVAVGGEQACLGVRQLRRPAR